VAKGTVYLYFETKIELLLICIAMEKKEYLDRIRPIFTEPMDPGQRLKRWLSTVLVMAHDMPLTSRLLRGDQELLAILDEMPPELMEENDQLRIDFLGNMIDAVAGEHRWNRIELEDRVKVLTGLTYLSGLLGNDHVRSGVSIDRFAAILADMVIDGIAPRTATRPESEEMAS
jgi:AcrR family transcriptional regulator